MPRERAIANQLAKLLSASTQPIYALDDRRRLIFCNAACAAWLEVTVEELAGQRCDYDSGESGDRIADLASRLCPPPEVFLGQLPASGMQISSGIDGALARRANCLSLRGAGGENVGVLVIADDTDDESACFDPALTGAQSAAQLHLRLQQLVHQLRMPYRLERLVGESFVMQRVREQARIAVETPVNVQIIGPAGCGREHLGRTIHAGVRPDQAGPLMPLACNLLDGELLQATVVAFLHRAMDADPAHPATLLLLDADQLNAEAQAELLAFFRVPTFALRTIATVRRPLVELAEEGEFLRELAYRLSTLTIQLPAIDQRREDLPLLCQRFLENFNARGEKQLSGFTADALDRLCSLPWQGDVQELEEVVRETCEQADGPMVTETDLSRRVKLVTSALKHPAPVAETIKLDEFLADVERELLQRALHSAKGNKAEAARLLGISRARVIRLAQQLGLP